MRSTGSLACRACGVKNKGIQRAQNFLHWQSLRSHGFWDLHRGTQANSFVLQVNAALEDAADLAEANKRMLVQAKTGAKMPTQEWKRAQTLLINIAVRDLTRNRKHMLATFFLAAKPSVVVEGPVLHLEL